MTKKKSTDKHGDSIYKSFKRRLLAKKYCKKNNFSHEKENKSSEFSYDDNTYYRKAKIKPKDFSYSDNIPLKKANKEINKISNVEEKNFDSFLLNLNLFNTL